MKRTSTRDLKPSYAFVNFSLLLIASVDGKQHLSEIVFSFIVHHEDVPQGQIITKEHCRDVLRRLRDSVRQINLMADRQEMSSLNILLFFFNNL